MCSYSVLLFLCYLVASHPVTVENADLLVLLAGHVVQTLVSLHITDLSQTHRKQVHCLNIHPHRLIHTDSRVACVSECTSPRE